MDEVILGKIAVVLGVIVLLANLIIPNPAWADFEAAVQATPSFDNPFDDSISFTPSLIANGTEFPDSVTNPAGVPNCVSPASDYFGCLTTRDGADSYVTDNAVDFQFNVRQGNIPLSPDLPILGIILHVQCRTVSGGNEFQIALTDSADLVQFQTDTLTCTSSQVFVDISFEVSFGPTIPNPRQTVSDFTGGLFTFVGGGTSVIDVSFVSVSYIIGAVPDCVSADSLAYIGCILQTFFLNVARFFRLIINALVFLAQGAAYLGGILAAFVGLFGVLFNLGAPSPFQELINVSVITMLLLLVVGFLMIARGSN